MGMDPWRLTSRFQGLDQRLIGPAGDAVIQQSLLL
jgi:hypothetical protein